VVLVDAGNRVAPNRNNAAWLCRVEPDQAAAAKQPEKAPPRVVYRNWMQGWDRHGPGNREKQKKVMDGLEANVWTHLPTPRDATQRDWSTTAYDTRRKQWLYWSGGFGETALPSVQAIPTGRAGSPSRPSTLRLSHIQSQQTRYAMLSVRRRLSIAKINARCRWKESLTGSATTVSTLRPRRSRRCVHSPCSQTGK